MKTDNNIDPGEISWLPCTHSSYFFPKRKNRFNIFDKITAETGLQTVVNVVLQDDWLVLKQTNEIWPSRRVAGATASCPLLSWTHTHSDAMILRTVEEAVVVVLGEILVQRSILTAPDREALFGGVGAVAGVSHVSIPRRLCSKLTQRNVRHQLLQAWSLSENRPGLKNDERFFFTITWDTPSETVKKHTEIFKHSA